MLPLQYMDHIRGRVHTGTCFRQYLMPGDQSFNALRPVFPRPRSSLLALSPRRDPRACPPKRGRALHVLFESKASRARQGSRQCQNQAGRPAIGVFDRTRDPTVKHKPPPPAAQRRCSQSRPTRRGAGPPPSRHTRTRPAAPPVEAAPDPPPPPPHPGPRQTLPPTSPATPPPPPSPCRAGAGTGGERRAAGRLRPRSRGPPLRGGVRV